MTDGERDAMTESVDSDALMVPAHGNGMLRPWKPGQSGNPKGRPPSIALAIRRFARMREPRIEQLRASGRLRKQDLIALAALDAAASGEIDFLRVLLDRIDGPLAQRTQSTVVHTHELVISPKPPRVLDVGKPASAAALEAPAAWTDGTDEPATS
jgi:hypothetical protein